MDFIKRLLFAIKSAFTSTIVGVCSSLVSVFYFVVAFDLFWRGNTDWTTPLRTIIFHTPLIIEVVVIVLVFVHNFTKKKIEQQTNALNATNNAATKSTETLTIEDSKDSKASKDSKETAEAAQDSKEKQVVE